MKLVLPMSPRRIALFMVGLALLVTFVFALSGNAPDANHTAARVAPGAPEPVRVRAEGRLVTYPGQEVVIGTDIGGRVVRLAVSEKSVVRRGDLIAQLYDDDVRAELAQAQAQIAESTAGVALADRDVERTEKLWTSQMVSQQALDRARHDQRVAAARKTTALASVQRLAAILAKTRITSPIDGVVIERHINAGEIVAAGAPLATVANLKRTRVEAEVDEFDAGHIALGDRVAVTAEGYEGIAWRGTVEEIPDAVVGRSLRPQDPSRPTDTRVLQVKIALAENTPLKLGQRVEVEITKPAVK